jgi:hypothetical protein
LAISEHEERSLEGSEKEKRLSGELYRASGAELVRERQRCRSLLQAFNTQPDERLAVLRDLLGRPGRWGLLIDCEEDRTLRAVLVGMLREAD